MQLCYVACFGRYFGGARSSSVTAVLAESLRFSWLCKRIDRSTNRPTDKESASLSADIVRNIPTNSLVFRSANFIQKLSRKNIISNFIFRDGHERRAGLHCVNCVCLLLLLYRTCAYTQKLRPISMHAYTICYESAPFHFQRWMFLISLNSWWRHVRDMIFPVFIFCCHYFRCSWGCCCCYCWGSIMLP